MCEVSDLADVAFEDVRQQFHRCRLNGLPSDVLTQTGDGDAQRAARVLGRHRSATTLTADTCQCFSDVVKRVRCQL